MSFMVIEIVVRGKCILSSKPGTGLTAAPNVAKLDSPRARPLKAPGLQLEDEFFQPVFHHQRHFAAGRPLRRQTRPITPPDVRAGLYAPPRPGGSGLVYRAVR